MITWTDEYNTYLREAWAEGATCKHIALAMTLIFPDKFTANMVAGKARTLNLPMRGAKHGWGRAPSNKVYTPKPRSQWIQQHIPIKVSKKAPALIKELVALCNEHKVSSTKFCERTGYSRGKWQNVRAGKYVSLDMLEDGFNLFGKTLTAVDK